MPFFIFFILQLEIWMCFKKKKRNMDVKAGSLATILDHEDEGHTLGIVERRACRSHPRLLTSKLLLHGREIYFDLV